MTKIRPSNSRSFWIAAAAVTVFVYFFGLNVPLVGPDESRYAQVAREMFLRGDWITPTLGGFDWFEKPALLYWLQISSYNVFGVSEFSARFGSALFGLATIAVLWLLGRKIERISQEEGRPIGEFANWLSLAAATSLGLAVFSRGASFDIILTFPMTAAMVCFFLFDLDDTRPGSDRKPSGHFLWLFGFYFFIGVALLAKGLIGIVFPFAIVGAYFLVSWRAPSRSFLVSVVWGTLVALAVAAAWYLPMYMQNGWKFIDEFFIQHHFQRYTSNKYLHPQPFYFFFWVLPLMTIPWLPFFVIAVWKFGKGAFHREGTPDMPRAALLRFSAAWLVVPLLFFSFSGSKLPGYILPAVPPAIVITAVYVMQFIRGGGRRASALKALAMTTFVVLTCVIIFALPKFADMDSVKGLIVEADSRGYGDLKVLTMHTVSHNAEFYAAGRLMRDDTGKQKRLPGTAEVLNEIRKTGRDSALVIVPVEYESQLTASPLFDSKIIRDNGEMAIVFVKAR